MKCFLSLAIVVALLDAPSWSQTTTMFHTTVKSGSTSVPPSQNDFKEAQNLLRVDRLWNKFLDWKEKGSSTADIIAHLSQTLGKDVAVEVRGKDGNLSSFELPQAPLGPTLSSVAALANAKLWAFPGRLVIAPEGLLTPEERVAVKAGVGGEWRESSTAGGARWNAPNRFQFIAVSLVGADLKERFAAKGLTPALPPPLPQTAGPRRGSSVYRPGPSTPAPPLAYELPLSDLSPETKEILQSLVNVEWERTQMFRRQATPNSTLSAVEAPVLDASTIVGFDDVQSQLQLVLQKVDPQDATKRKNINRWYVSKPHPTPAP